MHIDDVRRLHPAQCFVLPLPAASGVIGGQAFAVVLPHGVQVGIKLFGPCDRSERIAVVSPEDDRRLFPNPSLPHALLDRRDDRLDEPFGLVVVTAEGFTQANHESNVGKRFDEFNNRFGGVIGHQRVNPCLALFQAVLYGKGVRNVDIVEFEHNPNPRRSHSSVSQRNMARLSSYSSSETSSASGYSSSLTSEEKGWPLHK